MTIVNAIVYHLKESYDKQNLTLVVISNEIYETRRRLVSLVSYEMNTRLRSSISFLHKDHLFVSYVASFINLSQSING